MVKPTSQPPRTDSQSSTPLSRGCHVPPQPPAGATAPYRPVPAAAGPAAGRRRPGPGHARWRRRSHRTGRGPGQRLPHHHPHLRRDQNRHPDRRDPQIHLGDRPRGTGRAWRDQPQRSHALRRRRGAGEHRPGQPLRRLPHPRLQRRQRKRCHDRGRPARTAAGQRLEPRQDRHLEPGAGGGAEGTVGGDVRPGGSWRPGQPGQQDARTGPAADPAAGRGRPWHLEQRLRCRRRHRRRPPPVPPGRPIRRWPDPDRHGRAAALVPGTELHLPGRRQDPPDPARLLPGGRRRQHLPVPADGRHPGPDPLRLHGQPHLHRRTGVEHLGRHRVARRLAAGTRVQ